MAKEATDSLLGDEAGRKLSSQPAVVYVCEDDVATVTLNRPYRLNAVVPELVEGLCEALDAATRDGVAAAVITGSGRSFCSGHDLKHDPGELCEAEEQRRLQRIQDITRKVRQAPFPIIAAVHGYALGAGCEFALACDLIVATEDSEFGLPEVSVGLGVTGGISAMLPWAVGLAKAKELVLIGERFSANEAMRLGLINRVVAKGEHLNHALEMAAVLRSRPRRAAALAKSALDQGVQCSIDTAFETEVSNSMALHGTQDAVAAANSFRSRSTDGRAGV